MLHVINLTKIYKTKKGAETRALDGVTLQFPEKGMVFLLGKSGSGKSTLLNLCGGLDNPTSGEIIVKGRSSKHFSQSDFDSYRNTFVGFIFQEYNILNEFSVEDNVALALELQGKSKDKKAIAALLEQVDLTGFAKRKPNTLSGGQKQRIAIARALVKNPEIIMADEPTGALDSVTGKQVFDTLKKLSKDKLVLVVSHDREFAEQYGDRIIELKDGKILSDVTKTRQQQTAISQNLNAVGNVLCVKNGAELSDGDFEQIKAFLRSAGSDAVIAVGDKDVSNFKKASRINDSGEKEVFANTDEDKLEKKQYTKEDSRFISSRLPARHAVKIGLSGLKSKPFRLFLTVLLCTVAFVMFGLLSTLNFYDGEKTFRETVQMLDVSYLQAEKMYSSTRTFYSYGEETNSIQIGNFGTFGKGELEDLRKVYGAESFGAVRQNYSFFIRETPAPYWMTQIQVFAHLPENHSIRSAVQGEFPDKDDEIVLSTYIAESLVESQVYDGESKPLSLTAPGDLIGKTVKLGETVYTVTGLFDAGPIDSKYEPLKQAGADDDRLTASLSADLSDGLHLMAFITEGKMEEIFEEYQRNNNYTYDYRRITTDVIYDGETLEFQQWANAAYRGASEYDGTVRYLAEGKTGLAENEAVISSDEFYLALSEYYREAYDDLQETVPDEYDPVWAKKNQELQTLMETVGNLMTGSRWVYEEGKDPVEEALTAQEIETMTATVLARVKADNVRLTIGLKLFSDENQMPIGDTREYTVVGFFSDDPSEENGVLLADSVAAALETEQQKTVFSYDKDFTEYAAPADELYSTLYLSFGKTEEQISRSWELYCNDKYDESHSLVRLSGVFVEDLRFADSMVKTLSKVFLYVGLVLAVFAALLLSNFITVSISQKKRDIGILRAVGARSSDVFRIFFSESFFIAALCSVLAIAGTYGACYFINLALTTAIGASLVVFGVPSILILIGVAVLTAAVATFLPVYNAAKKKPVDSIRAV